jgi:hypothetical protein
MEIQDEELIIDRDLSKRIKAGAIEEINRLTQMKPAESNIILELTAGNVAQEVMEMDSSLSSDQRGFGKAVKIIDAGSIPKSMESELKSLATPHDRAYTDQTLTEDQASFIDAQESQEYWTVQKTMEQ